MSDPKRANFSPTKEYIHEIIFEADTPAGKYFDTVLMIFILGSVIVVMLESISELNFKYHHIFVALEWAFTIFFTIEYLLRIYCVYQPKKYMASFFGLVDLLAILPTYLSLLFPGTQYLAVIRALRLLRVFRIFKLANFLKESSIIMNALKASRPKITVFLVFIMLMVTIIGSIMYLVEGGHEGSSFTSIPRSIYFAIVTLTTVGYGDIAPQTELGQFLAAIVMIMGYAVIAVPTGIVSAEMVAQTDTDKTPLNSQCCQNCNIEGHSDDALYCRKCGESLHVKDHS